MMMRRKEQTERMRNDLRKIRIGEADDDVADGSKNFSSFPS